MEETQALQVQSNREDVMKAIDKLYEQSIEGKTQLNLSIVETAEKYLKKYNSRMKAAKMYAYLQIGKRTLVTAGQSALENSILSLEFQKSFSALVQMVAVIACIGGHDIKSDDMKSLVYSCIDTSVKDDNKKKENLGAISKIGHAAANLLGKLKKKDLTEKASIAIPVIVGVASGAMDFAETRVIVNKALKMFVDEDVAITETAEGVEEIADEVVAEVVEEIAEEGVVDVIKNDVVAVSSIEEIKKYKELLDMGIITPDEFEIKKKLLLGL